jgi:L-cystine uptake protein TcyP (sodium:dicarboxylate symporter family)
MKMPQTLITMMPTQVIRDFTSKNPTRSIVSIVSFSLSSKEDEDIVLLH